MVRVLIFIYFYFCMCVQVAMEARKAEKKGIGSLGDGVTGVYELPTQAGARN